MMLENDCCLLLDGIKGVDDDKKEDDQERHSTRDNLGINDEADPRHCHKQEARTIHLWDEN